jgi:hypothetical protein
MENILHQLYGKVQSVIDIEIVDIVERIQVGIDPLFSFDKESNKAYVSHGRSKYISVVDLITFEVERKIETKRRTEWNSCCSFSETPANV